MPLPKMAADLLARRVVTLVATRFFLVPDGADVVSAHQLVLVSIR